MLRAKGLLAAVLLATAVPVAAQVTTTRFVTAKYDADSTTETFCTLDDAETSGVGRLQTSGSSATVTGVSGTPFLGIGVFAQITVRTPLGNFVRTIVAKASDTSVTVDSAVNLTGGFAFTYRNVTCGTDGVAGWFKVSNQDAANIIVDVQQMNITTGGLDVRVQCVAASAVASPRQAYPVLTPPASGPTYINFTAVGGMFVPINEAWDRCRVGFKVGTTDDGGDTGADQEQVTITAQLRRFQ